MTDPYQMEYFQERRARRRRIRRRRFAFVLKWSIAALCIGVGAAFASSFVVRGVDAATLWYLSIFGSVLGFFAGFIGAFRLTLTSVLKPDPHATASTPEAAWQLGIPSALVGATIVAAAEAGIVGFGTAVAGGLCGLGIWWCSTTVLQRGAISRKAAVEATAGEIEQADAGGNSL